MDTAFLSQAAVRALVLLHIVRDDALARKTYLGCVV